jgi:hypothetical protein
MNNDNEYNWHKHNMHKINSSRVSLLKQVEMWPSRYCTELKYLCDYGNYNPIWPSINCEISYATEGSCAYLKKLVHKYPTLAQIAYF